MAVFAGRISGNGVYDFSSQVDLTGKAGQEWKVPDGRWAIISFEILKTLKHTLLMQHGIDSHGKTQ